MVISRTARTTYFTKNLLLTELTGLAPIHSSLKDKWGWGKSDKYTSNQGYSALQSNMIPLQAVSLQKSVWSSPSIPKVNFFTWLLMHKRAFTHETLTGRGFLGPYRCFLCNQDVQTFDHLFVECDFSRKAWVHILHSLPVPTPTQIEIVSMFISWKSRYLGILSNIPGWSKIW